MDINTIKNLMNAGFITQVIDPSMLAEKSVEELMEMGLITQVVDKDELEAAVTSDENPTEPQSEQEQTTTPNDETSTETPVEPQSEPEQTITPSDEELLNQMIEEEENNQ